MKANDVLDLLEKNANPRGIENFKRMNMPEMDSYGLGLTQIKTLAKSVPKNNEVAKELWNSKVMDAKHMACLTCNPKAYSKDELKAMAKESVHWMVAHTFNQNVVAKSPHLKELAETWSADKDDGLRAAGYNALAYLAKQDKKLDDAYFLPQVEEIQSKLQGEENFVRDAMNTALFQIGMRSKALHARALPAAKRIGTVKVDYGENSCEAVDVVKHLSSERVMKKFA